jgi:hypothetical protein
MLLLQYQDTLAQFTEAAVRGYALHQRVDNLLTRICGFSMEAMQSSTTGSQYATLS